jgi:cytochrome c
MKKYLLILVIAVMAFVSNATAQSEPTPTPVPKDSTSWFNAADTAIFKGKYKVEGMPFDYVEVVVKEAKLYFFAAEYEGFLTPLKEKKDAFDALGQAVFTFSRNADATDIEGLKIDYNGMEILGKKEKK